MNEEKEKEKITKNQFIKSKWFIFVIIGILIVVGVSLVLIFTKDEEYYNPPPGEIMDDPDWNVGPTEEEEGNMVDGLERIASEIYDSGKYLNYSKTNSGTYFITLGEIRELGYSEIDSLVSNNCSDGHAILFFNPNMDGDDDGYPVGAVADCGGTSVE